MLEGTCKFIQQMSDVAKDYARFEAGLLQGLGSLMSKMVTASYPGSTCVQDPTGSHLCRF